MDHEVSGRVGYNFTLFHSERRLVISSKSETVLYLCLFHLKRGLNQIVGLNEVWRTAEFKVNNSTSKAGFEVVEVDKKI